MKIDLKNAVITLIDGSTTPKTLDINIGEGTLTFTQKRNIEYVKNRGKLDTTRQGDEEPVDIRLDIVWEFLNAKTADTIATPYEFLTQSGKAAAYKSSSNDLCEPYAVDLKVVYTLSCGTATSETITFSDFRYTSLDGDLKAGTLSVTGSANVTAPTVVRT